MIDENFLTKHKKNMERIYAGLNRSEKRKAALMCLERQFKAYQQFAENKQWNRSEEYREILDTCWGALLENKKLDEDIWEKHEEIKPENVHNTTKEYAQTEFAFGNIFASNMEDFLDMLLDDTGGEVSFCLFNIEFIMNYSDDDVIQDKNVTSECIKREVENQTNDAVQQKNLKNLIDVQNWYEQADNLIEYINKKIIHKLD